ncbi:hypothetical protein BFP72_08490 [Reichenbachiella sp. 5M10]|uniref:hypothetical protein n=1 Tax=Reichenbachiella sp. 5M10 TaxID=1889772 RepID=UPI000C15E5AA|nr:hypothetical protein [Reichenbachiella sp. 5M10]PIB35430.1 hypothetical protein BFP72_08490 [Reichenbachiella sp. 5M10]
MKKALLLGALLCLGLSTYSQSHKYEVYVGALNEATPEFGLKVGMERNLNRKFSVGLIGYFMPERGWGGHDALSYGTPLDSYYSTFKVDTDKKEYGVSASVSYNLRFGDGVFMKFSLLPGYFNLSTKHSLHEGENEHVDDSYREKIENWIEEMPTGEGSFALGFGVGFGVKVFKGIFIVGDVMFLHPFKNIPTHYDFQDGITDVTDHVDNGTYDMVDWNKNQNMDPMWGYMSLGIMYRFGTSKI